MLFPSSLDQQPLARQLLVGHSSATMLETDFLKPEVRGKGGIGVESGGDHAV